METKQRCSFCGKFSDGIIKMVTNDANGATVCENCIKYLKELKDKALTNDMNNGRPDPTMRMD